MRLSSRIIRIIFLVAVFISTTILVYAAATISNPLCSLEQVTNFPNIGMGHYMASISGDGNRAAVGAAPIGTDTEIWNLSTNTSIDIIDGAGFPVLDYDGSRIAFYSRDNLTGQNAAGTYELFLWDNGTVIQLTSFADPNITIAPPDISDDGTKIVFATSPGTNPLGNSIKNYYIWREGSGISALIANPTTAETPAFAYTPIRITADGNHAVFVHDSQLSPDAPTGSGFVYKMNLTTGVISYLFEIETFEGDDEADMSFMFIDADASRIAFSSPEDYAGQNPDNELLIWIWDETDGFRSLDNGPDMPIYYYLFSMGFSADGNRLLFTSAFDPTGENPDGTFEYYIYEYQNDSIRQISSRTGLPMLYPANEGLSADGTKAVISLPPGTDYEPDDPAGYEVEMFEAICEGGSSDPLTAPNNLRTTSVSSLSISLAWNDNATSETNYLLERRFGSSHSWTQIASLGPNTSSYTDNNLYCYPNIQYRIRAYRGYNNTYSYYSNTLFVTTPGCSGAIAAPSNLRIGSMTDGVLLLEWNDNANNESTYFLEYSDSAGANWWSANGSAPSSTSRTIWNLPCGRQYLYRVRAYRGTDDTYSPFSNILQLTTPACTDFGATNLRIRYVSTTSISIEWDKTGIYSDSSMTYGIERSTDGGTSWVNLGTQSLRIYNDTGLTCSPSASYQYRVRALLTYRSSIYSNVLTVPMPCPEPTAPPAPSAPTNLRTTSVTYNNIALAWSDRATDETAYELERSTDAGTSWTVIANLNANSISYTNSSLTCNSAYQYRIRAYRGTDTRYSAYSNILTVTTPHCPPLAPSNITATVSGTTITINWTDNANDETSYEFQRLEPSSHAPVVSLPANSTSYFETVPCNTYYSYRVRAVNTTKSVSSTWAVVNYFHLACPPLVASSLSSTNTVNSITLNWTPDITAQSFILSYNNGSQWYTLGTFDTSTTSYTHSNLSCHQTYLYRIETIRTRDNTRASSMNTFSTAACPPLDTPAAPVILSTQANLINLQIPAMPTGASSMNLERSIDGLTWFGIGLANGGYMDVNVLCATTYHYRLVAYRASDGQYSPASASVSTTTPACPVAVSMILGTYSAGTWSFVDSNATANPANTFNFGDASWQGIVGDWDGDGVDGIGLYRNGEFVLRSVVNGAVQESRFNFGGSTGYQAVAGDWNGDGIDTIGVFGNGQFILSDDNINFHYRFNLGDGSGWQAIAGDWDGNGADGVALYKDGFWHLVDSAINPVSQSIAYGPAQAGWLPVAGDWNGDGMDTIGLYNNGVWRIRLESNTGGAEGSFFFGAAGAIPLSTFEGGIPTGDYSQEVFMIPLPEPELTPEVTPES